MKYDDENNKEIVNDIKATEMFDNAGEEANQTDRIRIWKQLGEKSVNLGDIEEAIRYYKNIYDTNVHYVDEMRTLARLYYEQKKDVKEAIHILNECLRKSNSDVERIAYLCEMLRAVRSESHEKYQKLEAVIEEKLSALGTNDIECNTKLGTRLLVEFHDVIQSEDIELFYKLAKIYQGYQPKGKEQNQEFQGMEQFVGLMEQEKVHPAILLLYQDHLTESQKNKLQDYLNHDKTAIEQSLDTIRKNAPDFYHFNRMLFAECTKVVKKQTTHSSKKQAENKSKQQPEQADRRYQKRYTKRKMYGFILLAVIFLLAGGGYMRNLHKNREMEKYKETHNGILTKKEMTKVKDLWKQYDKLTDVEIRYYQIGPYDKGTNIKHDGRFIYVVYQSMGLSFPMGTKNVYSNVFSNAEMNELSNRLAELYNGEETDYEKCEKYFKLTYDFLKETGLDKAEKAYKAEVTFEDAYIHDHIVDGSLSHGQESGAVFDRILSERYPYMNMNVRNYYAKALYELGSYGITPSGDRIELAYIDSPTIGKFAVEDVDGDGRAELVLSLDQTDYETMCSEIYEYNPTLKQMHMQLFAGPELIFFYNGAIMEPCPKNYGLGTKLWPYTLYTYNNRLDKYVDVGDVDSWEKKTYPEDFAGNSFPNRFDTDHDGILYSIQTDDENSYDLNRDDYEAWRDRYIEDSSEFDIKWYPLYNLAYER